MKEQKQEIQITFNQDQNPYSTLLPDEIIEFKRFLMPFSFLEFADKNVVKLLIPVKKGFDIVPHRNHEGEIVLDNCRLYVDIIESENSPASLKFIQFEISDTAWIKYESIFLIYRNFGLVFPEIGDDDPGIPTCKPRKDNIDGSVKDIITFPNPTCEIPLPPPPPPGGNI